MISLFRGEYRFLSNFYPSPVKTYDGFLAPTVEHSYQYEKFLGTKFVQELILKCRTPGETKILANKQYKHLVRKDWLDVSLGVMYRLLQEKFNDIKLKNKLLKTGTEELVEGNNWGDVFWGQCPVGVGENHLGKLLMRIRDELGKL